MKLFWADLHNHNEIGYGQGSMDRSYALAENTLDVYAFSPHGFWPDPPAGDAKLTAYHTEAIERISAAYPSVVAKANERYRPGKFVTLVAYEWHSIQWGDYVVIFPNDTGTLHRAPNLDDLKDFARHNGALLIPHHVGYKHGWRGLNWDEVDSTLSPLVEVFSEHGNSLERNGLWPMLPHSMGGVTASQTGLAQMRKKRHFGLTAGTDNHYGYPANYGEGITGIIAEELTREAVLDALCKRHTCIATGDRMELSVSSGEAIMGDVLPVSAAREFEIFVQPLTPLDTVQVIRNGETIHTWGAPFTSNARPASDKYFIRLDWGWGRMGHAELTQWQIDVQVNGGTLLRKIPCFCGGASVELKNLIAKSSSTECAIESFTSRKNSSPINGVVLEIQGEPSTKLDFSACAAVGDEKGTCEVSATIGQLIDDDAWGMPLTRFSSPRIRVGQAHSADAISFAAAWRDTSPSERDLYMIKAQQQNGQCVWSSPILFANAE